ncbi:MAG: dUTP diphosphatase [Lachnospiraceae bacterium]|nr:dUTP diphosphatase [Lachnospiraceae bacterium]
MEIRIKKLTDTAKIPTRGSEYAAGYDLYADLQEPVTIMPGKSVGIPTGISMEIPHGYFGAIYARSGIAVREGIRLSNCTAVIDEDYRGEFRIFLYNDSENPRAILPGERIAQLIIQKYETAEFIETDELGGTARGTGGFGSTGRL